MTLIAKAIQGLANLTGFGAKEPWMEPMNKFFSGHRQDFKDFIDQICTISADRGASAMPPSYATPLTIMNRLSQKGFSQEGFPSLPYLIDHARSFANLVNLWLSNSSAAARTIQETDCDLLRFHELCVQLHQKTVDCLNRAERAERPSSRDSLEWEEVVGKLDPFSTAQSSHDDAESILSIATPSSLDGIETPPEPTIGVSTTVNMPLRLSSNLSGANISIEGEALPRTSKAPRTHNQRKSKFGDFMAARRKAWSGYEE